MRDTTASHWDAVEHHTAAARNHDRAARFWDAQGDAERAQLQHEMASYELLGAELERRWAELVETDADAGRRREPASELVVNDTRMGAKHASEILSQLAKTLERSAELAEEHARRYEQSTGGDGPAEEERRTAERAHEAARRARSQAAHWLKLVREP